MCQTLEPLRSEGCRTALSSKCFGLNGDFDRPNATCTISGVGVQQPTKTMVYNDGRATGHTEGRTARRAAQRAAKKQQAAAATAAAAPALPKPKPAAPAPEPAPERPQKERDTAKRAARQAERAEEDPAERKRKKVEAAQAARKKPAAPAPSAAPSSSSAAAPAVLPGGFDPCLIYVGGLPFWYTEEKLREDFGALGEIVKTHPMRFPDTGKFRGIALVTFAEPSAATAALEWNGSESYEGRFLVVKRGRPDPNKRS